MNHKYLHVALTDEQRREAAIVARARQAGALRRGYHDKHGFDQGSRDPLDVHRQGVEGELAVAVALGIEWQPTLDTFQEGVDVAAYQVRTRSASTYDLLIRPTDRPDDVFVLVTGDYGRYVVVGWIVARDGMRPEWLHDYGGRPPAYFVPQVALHPFTFADPLPPPPPEPQPAASQLSMEMR